MLAAILQHQTEGLGPDNRLVLRLSRCLKQAKELWDLPAQEGGDAWTFVERGFVYQPTVPGSGVRNLADHAYSLLVSFCGGDTNIMFKNQSQGTVGIIPMLGSTDVLWIRPRGVKEILQFSRWITDGMHALDRTRSFNNVWILCVHDLLGLSVWIEATKVNPAVQENLQLVLSRVTVFIPFACDFKCTYSTCFIAPALLIYGVHSHRLDPSLQGHCEPMVQSMYQIVIGEAVHFFSFAGQRAVYSMSYGITYLNMYAGAMIDRHL